MDSLEFKLVKDAISICGKKVAGRKYIITFSNNQTLSFSINRPMVLLSLGFNGNLIDKPSDKRIISTYENLNKIQKNKMLETAIVINEMLQEGDFEHLDKFVMLMYNDFQNKLELVVTTDNGKNYNSLMINNFRKSVEGFKRVDDVIANMIGNNFAIPTAFICTRNNEVIVDEKLTKKEFSDAKEAALLISNSCDANLTDNKLMIKYTDELKKEDRKLKRIYKKYKYSI